jgi:hypothetical protein
MAYAATRPSLKHKAPGTRGGALTSRLALAELVAGDAVERDLFPEAIEDVDELR